MTRAERDWRDGQPGEAALEESAGQAGRINGDDPLVEDVHDDPLAERVHEDDPLVQDVRHDPVAEPAPGADPLAEPAPGIAGDEDGGAGARQEPHDQLTGDGEQERFVARWQEIQAGFVDEPRRAVQDADALVVDMMDRLARMLASEREQLESAGETGKISTEDLRQGLRRYRALFERLLAV